MRRSFVLVLSLFALAASLLVPLRAQAVILQACENEPAFTSGPALQEPLCALARIVDDATGETADAPICDPQGASAIAPTRILPIPDARIDMQKPCSSPVVSPVLSPRNPSEPLAHPDAHVAQPVLATAFAFVPVPTYETAMDFLPVGGAYRAGVRQDVYHPPR